MLALGEVRCTVCKKDISISNMGLKANLSHAKGMKHIRGMELAGYRPFETRSNKLKPDTMLGLKDKITKAEIHIMLAGFDANISHSAMETILHLADPDSKICTGLSVNRHKPSISIRFGLGKYFEDMLIKSLDSSEGFSIGMKGNFWNFSQ